MGTQRVGLCIGLLRDVPLTCAPQMRFAERAESAPRRSAARFEFQVDTKVDSARCGRWVPHADPAPVATRERDAGRAYGCGCVPRGSGKSFARAPPRVARNPNPPPRPGGRRAAARTGGRHARPAVGGSGHCALWRPACPCVCPAPDRDPRRLDTLKCQTLKVREPVRRSFVTDLAEFRHQ